MPITGIPSRSLQYAKQARATTKRGSTPITSVRRIKMRRYETIYILRPSLGEAEITTVIENTNKIITEAGGTIIDMNKWGMKKLAYLIKKESQGYYVYCDYATSPEAVTELERKFRIDDSVLKYMTVKLADSISAEGVAAATSEIEQKIAEAKEAEEAEASEETDEKAATDKKEEAEEK